MKKIIGLVSVVALCAACAAFDSDSKTINGFNPDGSLSGSPGANKYEGFYSGKATQTSNSCSQADLSAQGGELQVDVVQGGDTVNMQFADGQEGNGNLEDGNKVTVKVDRAGVAWLYTFNFDEAKASGNIDVVETTTEGQLDAACAKYNFELEKQKEKPDNFGHTVIIPPPPAPQ